MNALIKVVGLIWCRICEDVHSPNQKGYGNVDLTCTKRDHETLWREERPVRATRPTK